MKDKLMVNKGVGEISKSFKETHGLYEILRK